MRRRGDDRRRGDRRSLAAVAAETLTGGAVDPGGHRVAVDEVMRPRARRQPRARRRRHARRTAGARRPRTQRVEPARRDGRDAERGGHARGAMKAKSDERFPAAHAPSAVSGERRAAARELGGGGQGGSGSDAASAMAAMLSGMGGGPGPGGARGRVAPVWVTC